MSIGSVDGAAVTEARRRIELILDPPKVENGAVYMGKVVSITKFGAFINILPGRDGLMHISKVGKGERVNNVEDVLSLGQAIEVRVDDIDVQGKVSLNYADAPASAPGAPREDRGPRSDSRGDTRGDSRGDSRGGRDDRGGRGPRPDRDRDRGPRRDDARPSSPAPRSTPNGSTTISFDEAFDAQIAQEIGDLGPSTQAAEAPSESRGDSRGGPRRRRRS